MTDSIREQIMQNVVAALSTINIANGYGNEVASIQRQGLNTLSLVNVPLLYVFDGEDLVMREKKAAPAVYRRMELYVSVATRPDENTESRSGSSVLNSLCADVERCIMTDVTRGGLAIWTDNPDWMEAAFEDDLPHLAKALRFTIDYRHHFKDPMVKA